MHKYLTLSLVGFFCTCQPDVSIQKQGDAMNTAMPHPTKSFVATEEQYVLHQPNEVWTLDRRLTEISGLTYHAATDALFAINDEQGIIFILDRQNKGKIIATHSLDKHGDYEGIAQIGAFVTAVLKSNGQLYFYNHKTGMSAQVNTPLSAKNNVEGLTYDSRNNMLLLACKGQLLSNLSRQKNAKAVYAYSLSDKKLIEKPFLTVTDQDLLALMADLSKQYSKSQFKALKKRVRSFAPSGIAIHPQTGTYYILSAKGKLLLTVSQNKALQDIFFLNPKIIPQAEGICFDQEGQLYISTEGKGFYGKIFKFGL